MKEKEIYQLLFVVFNCNSPPISVLECKARLTRKSISTITSSSLLSPCRSSRKLSSHLTLQNKPSFRSSLQINDIFRHVQDHHDPFIYFQSTIYNQMQI